MVGKADESQVLKKAKKLDRKAKVVEVKKGENAAKKVEEKKKEPDSKKKEEPNITWPNDPRNYYPFYHPYYHYPYPAPPPFQPDGPYRPSQAYPPHYYPETDYTYYNYPNNPRYLTHIRHSWAAVTITQNSPHYLTYIKHTWAFLCIIMLHTTSVQISTSLILLYLILIRKDSESSPPSN